jgi:hypothetical protein
VFQNRRRLAAPAAVAAFIALGVAVPAAARADIPSPLVTVPFNAAECPGETASDPTDSQPSPITTDVIPDLTLVFGDRLDQYNAGGVVVLYDSAGDNRTDDAYPPLCGVRHVNGGPVSEWMFCTDLWAHTCGRMGAAGGLVDSAGDPMAPLAELGSRNARLTDDQEKIIAYLVRHGYAFTVPLANGGYPLPSGFARADGTTDERYALQELVWCVSDDPAGWPELDAVCRDAMDAAEQAHILSLVPDVPVVELDLDSASGSTALAIGETAVVTLRTNLYHQPIDLVASGVPGDLTVLSGPATLGAGTVTVAGSDPDVPTTVTLGFRATGAGDVVLSASTRPVSVEDLGWSQSSGDFAGDGDECQVYATFRAVELDTLADQASARFAGLAETGRADAGAGLALSGALLAAGGLLVAAATMRRGSGRHALR